MRSQDYKRKARKDATCGHGGKAKAFGLCVTCYRHLYFENHHKLESERAHQWQVEHYESAAAHKRAWRERNPNYDTEYRKTRRPVLRALARHQVQKENAVRKPTAAEHCLLCGRLRPSGHVIVRTDTPALRKAGVICSSHTLAELILAPAERIGQTGERFDILVKALK